jgi:hypothetical protein
MAYRWKMATVKGGPIRIAIEAQRSALGLFRKKDANEILRGVLALAGSKWIPIFLPKRFTEYATRFLQYDAQAKYEARKVNLAKRGVIAGPQPLPLVYTGASRAAALKGARASGVATSKKAAILIRFPRGSINFKKSHVLKIVPAHEINRIAEWVARDLPVAIMGGVNQGLGNPTSKRAIGASSPLRTMRRRDPRRIGGA